MKRIYLSAEREALCRRVAEMLAGGMKGPKVRKALGLTRRDYYRCTQWAIYHGLKVPQKRTIEPAMKAAADPWAALSADAFC